MLQTISFFYIGENRVSEETMIQCIKIFCMLSRELCPMGRNLLNDRRNDIISLAEVIVKVDVRETF